jgi:hypothetical protein
MKKLTKTKMKKQRCICILNSYCTGKFIFHKHEIPKDCPIRELYIHSYKIEKKKIK